MQFAVEDDIFATFPGMRIAVAVAQGIRNDVPSADVTRDWEESWREAGEAASRYGNAQSNPRVAPWRERMRAIGVSPKEFPSSIEAMVRRAIKGGPAFSINPIVDFYNAVSLRHTVPAGAFDIGVLQGPLQLRRTAADDTFLALDAAEPVAVPLGEVAYTDGATVLTRHFVWRQSRAGLIEPSTTSVFLVSEVLGEVGADVADAVLEDFRGGLEQYFGVEAQIFLVDAERPSIAWE